MGTNRLQTAVFAAIGIVILLLGIRAVRDAGTPAAVGGGSGSPLASTPVGSGAGAGPASGDVVVHVAGAVSDPGVYRLPAGSRVADALERAGGPAGRGRPDAINLAARLADGQQVVVPARGESAGAATGEDGPISLGAADQADLETIEGIGPVTAADIIEFRDERGGIASIEELDEIPGIGPATIESLR
ncbi:MAG: ComEA family DNA-binding protein, partial [Thermoleophilia bacterium]|nr:ComEA family DNA-binding protein [Thermoleophilia bacterium]